MEEDNKLLSMNWIWGHYPHLIKRGVEICDHLNVDFVGVEFTDTGARKYITVSDLQEQASRRGGIINYNKHSTLSGLLEGKKGQARTMDYSKFMNTFVWNHHFYCSKVVLDV